MIESIKAGITYGIVAAGSVIGFLFIIGLGFVIVNVVDHVTDLLAGEKREGKFRNHF